MDPLATLKAACLDALEAIEKNNDWRDTYCEIVDPRSVLVLTQQLEAKEIPVTVGEPDGLKRLVRDLAGYLKMVANDKPDPVRDDLLLQARQLTE